MRPLSIKLEVMKNNKINFLDLIVIIAVVLLGAIFALGKIYESPVPKSNVIVRIDVNSAEQVSQISDEAAKEKTVYLNSVNTPVKVKEVKKLLDGSGKVTGLQIYLDAPGEITDSKYIFNGQRILVGQKAELHGGYFAQGIISSIEYAK